MSRKPRSLSDAAQKIIWRVRTIGAADPDPHRMLANSARSVTIIGKMIESLAMQYEVAGKSVGAKIALAGQFLWGIVEVSVPNRLLNYVGRNWIALIAVIGTAIVALNIVAKVPGMGKIGWIVLLIALLLRLLVYEFSRWMRVGQSRWRILTPLAGLVLALVLLMFAASYFADHAAQIIKFRDTPLIQSILNWLILLWHKLALPLLTEPVLAGRRRVVPFVLAQQALEGGGIAKLFFAMAGHPFPL